MNYNGEERRKNPCMHYDDFIKKLDGNVDLIMDRQAFIKDQVEKTNGRVTVLEKFMWTVLGGAGIFAIFSLTKLTEILSK